MLFGFRLILILLSIAWIGDDGIGGIVVCWELWWKLYIKLYFQIFLLDNISRKWKHYIFAEIRAMKFGILFFSWSIQLFFPFCYFPSFSQQPNKGLLNFVCTTFFNFLLKNFNFCVFFFFTKSNLCSYSNQFHKKKHIEILFYFLVIFGFFNKKYIWLIFNIKILNWIKY